MIAPLEPPPTSSPKLLDRVRWHLRVKHYSIRTEQAYLDWIRRFILFHHKRHPDTMGEEEIAAFLTHLAVQRHVAASTQNQALCALLFLYGQVLERKLDFMEKIERVTRPAKIPVVLTRDEAHSVLAQLGGNFRLMAELLYGSGLRLLECARLRVKDIDFGYGHITVRDGKGMHERVTLCPNECGDRYNCILKGSGNCTDATSPAAVDRFTSHSHCGENTPTRDAPGRGSTYFQPQNSPPIHALVRSNAITFREKPSECRQIGDQAGGRCESSQLPYLSP
jgi:hypothetical protein